jgi:protoporphyrinogen oxidase
MRPHADAVARVSQPVRRDGDSPGSSRAVTGRQAPPPGGGRTAIVGAGPAGLTAALELARLGREAAVFEADDQVGGISRTVVFRGCRLDIGGHRFFTKVPEIERLWHDILGDDLIVRPRMSRIYYGGTFFDYPLRPVNALRGLGVVEAVRVLASYVHAQLFPVADERTFDVWVSNRFGRRLFEVFFKTYTEKVWGMPCSEISAAWAAQRIKNLDLMAALRNALLGSAGAGRRAVTSLIERFHYPRFGPGMMWERCRDLAAARGVPTHLRTRVVRVLHEGGRVYAVDVVGPDGAARREPCDTVISSMPVGDLVRAMDPAPPAEVLEAAGKLRHRDFLIVALVVDRDQLFPDNWIYVHSPEVHVGRVQNFKNWSPDMVDDPNVSFIGLEYFTNRGDALWQLSDEALIALGTSEAATIGLFSPSEVSAGTVVRMPKAYPVYDGEYEEHLQTLRGWLDRIDNLFTVGRNGLHRYNNQDHSMLTALYAVRSLTGARRDVWTVNEEESFHEEIRDEAGTKVHDRLTPMPVEGGLDGLLREAFAEYDAIALGGAFGITAAAMLAVTTALLLWGPNDGFVPMLSLLGHYLFGYEVSWPGLLVGIVEAGVGGFAVGWIVARLINLLTAMFLRNLERQLATLTAFEAVDGGRVDAG